MGTIWAAWAWSTGALLAMTGSLLAAKEGKKLKDARVEFGVGQDRFDSTLKVDQFQFQTLRLPAGKGMEEEEEEEETALSPMVKEEIPRIKKWV